MMKNAQVIDLHLCSCDELLKLTYCETYQSLDQTLVKVTLEATAATSVSLYIGAYEDEACTPELLATLSRDNQQENTDIQNAIIPINLLSGQRLSLMINGDNSDNQLTGITQLIAIYCNQHEHLNRANKDRLTGLKNRRAFDSEYTNLINDAELSTSDTHCTFLAILDIDYFKKVNDQYGHLIGDETLITLSHILKSFFRKNDSLYRFGGEEFIVAIKQVTPDEAKEQLEQLRATIADYVFPQVGQKTVSIGYVRLVSNLDKGLLFEQADAALYKAKEYGRNNLKNYEELVQKNIIPPIDVRDGGIDLF